MRGRREKRRRMHPVSRIFLNPGARERERERERERSGRNDWLARTKWRGLRQKSIARV